MQKVVMAVRGAEEKIDKLVGEEETAETRPSIAMERTERMALGAASKLDILQVHGAISRHSTGEVTDRTGPTVLPQGMCSSLFTRPVRIYLFP
jgi:hypothetical protein